MSQVLDLSKVFERDTVKMRDGTDYELRNPQEFSVLEEHKLQTLIAKANEFDKKETKNTEDVEKASELLQDLATMLVVDLQTEIPDWACVAIFRFWMERATGDDPLARPNRKARRTTAASSRASKRSTAATPKRGSTSPSGR